MKTAYFVTGLLLACAPMWASAQQAGIPKEWHGKWASSETAAGLRAVCTPDQPWTDDGDSLMTIDAKSIRIGFLGEGTNIQPTQFKERTAQKLRGSASWEELDHAEEPVKVRGNFTLWQENGKAFYALQDGSRSELGYVRCSEVRAKKK